MNAKNRAFEGFSKVKLASADHFAGYMINEQGEALKITEAMIKHACQELKARCQLPVSAKL